MMVQLARAEALKGLKRFTILADHAALLSQYAPDPEYWHAQANARRTVYAWLIELVQTRGVDHAYHAAQRRYADLPLVCHDPSLSGQRAALESFFTILGKNEVLKGGEVQGDAQVEA
ncbi:MAG TPA: hypothetical protein GX008_02470 [Firmicutes bacterium]|jgi:hypothetical protein|nr:MAG: hypothetical protein AA931_02800 [Peptococcaceae bacterium 1109]HHT72561.1 hypothetical protein [Bacillota bacterium]